MIKNYCQMIKNEKYTDNQRAVWRKRGIIPQTIFVRISTFVPRSKCSENRHHDGRNK